MGELKTKWNFQSRNQNKHNHASLAQGQNTFPTSLGLCLHSTTLIAASRSRKRRRRMRTMNSSDTRLKSQKRSNPKVKTQQNLSFSIPLQGVLSPRGFHRMVGPSSHQSLSKPSQHRSHSSLALLQTRKLTHCQLNACLPSKKMR